MFNSAKEVAAERCRHKRRLRIKPLSTRSAETPTPPASSTPPSPLMVPTSTSTTASSPSSTPLHFLLKEFGINTCQIWCNTASILNSIRVNSSLHEDDNLSSEFGSGGPFHKRFVPFTADAECSDEVLKSLITDLDSSFSVESIRSAITEIHMLAKHNPENCLRIACTSAVCPLITLISHFSPTVDRISTRFILSPSMAAVTLLTLGIGTPNTFASTSALHGGHARTDLATILSAGTFVVVNLPKPLTISDFSPASMYGSQMHMAYQGVPGTYSEAVAGKAYPTTRPSPVSNLRWPSRWWAMECHSLYTAYNWRDHHSSSHHLHHLLFSLFSRVIFSVVPIAVAAPLPSLPFSCSSSSFPSPI